MRSQPQNHARGAVPHGCIQDVKKPRCRGGCPLVLWCG